MASLRDIPRGPQQYRTSKILGPDGKPARVPIPRAIYDAAQTTTDNRRHWANADLLGAVSANSLAVRQKLRARSRYERANNGYANGLIETLANDLIGTGPTLQVLLEDEEANSQIEARFAEWAEAAGLVEKLQLAKKAKAGDGEAFLLFDTNPQQADLVQLTLRSLECDRVSTPNSWLPGKSWADNQTDGIEFDGYGNPVAYTVLREHPGDSFLYNQEYDRIRAERVIHWFRSDRPGQVRGVPEITPALPLFAQLRRYTLSVLAAAETAADFSALLETEMSPSGDADVAEGEPFEALEINKRMLTTLPAGYKMHQLQAEQPTTTYEMFKRELLKEIGRCTNTPFNVIAGDSSLYNYSSARLDLILFYRGAVVVERDHCRRMVLSRVLPAWYAEGRLIPGYLPAGLPDRLPHTWYWPGFSSIDPLKDADADRQNLANFTTTLKELAAEKKQDWRDIVEQAGIERKLIRDLGLDIETVAERIRTEPQDVAGKEDGDEPADEEAPPPKSRINGYHFSDTGRVN